MTTQLWHRCVSCDTEFTGRIGRGLCDTCYNVAKRTGTLEDWPRTNRHRSEVIEEVMWLSEQGTPAAQWSVRLNMTITAIERALYRAGCNSLANQAGRVRRQEET